MKRFEYEPSRHVPFRDREVIDRVRGLSREELTRHPNPDFRIRIVPDADVEHLWVADMFHRIHAAAEAGRRCVMILPNPCPLYRHVARLINRFRLPCDHLTCFAMDEYADQDGRVAPPEWPASFTRAMRSNFLDRLDEDLRPPEEQFVGFTTENTGHYSELIAEAGGADICYSGPGWTGHLAFIEPDAPEFDAPLAEWRTFGARLVTLSPYTLAQNSLHGVFGMSGDLAAVPPRAATIGPADVIAARARLDVSSIGVHETATSWQRLVTRLCTHGPVTPKLPTSILQELATEKIISETIAMPIEPRWEKGY
jgi:glucosamine-6-phosphate deaminase